VRQTQTVKPPLEKACSTSVDVATHIKYIRDVKIVEKQCTNLELIRNPVPFRPRDAQQQAFQSNMQLAFIGLTTGLDSHFAAIFGEHQQQWCCHC
jgi:hypothetical protein